MKDLNNIINKRPFVKNVALLVSGTALSQIIVVAISPIITRLFSPSDFGAFGVYTAVVGIFVTIAALKYDQALMLPQSIEEASNILAIASMSILLTSGVFALLCYALIIYAPGIFINIQIVKEMKMFIPVSILLSAMYQLFIFWSSRKKLFIHSSISQISRGAVLSGSQTLAGFHNLGPFGLIAGTIIGDSCALVYLIYRSLKADFDMFKKSINIATMARLLKEYKDFPLYGGPQSLLNAISQSLPILLFAQYYGSSTAGLYAMSVRILQLPSNLLLNSIRQVYFQRANELYNNKGDVFLLFLKTTIGLAAIIILPGLLIILFAPYLFSTVLGDEWYKAGIYARWLILWIISIFANVPSVLTAQIYRKQKLLLIFDVILLISRSGIIIYGGAMLSDLDTIIAYSVIGAIFNVALIIWAFNFTLRRRYLDRNCSAMNNDGSATRL